VKIKKAPDCRRLSSKTPTEKPTRNREKIKNKICRESVNGGAGRVIGFKDIAQR
jgi:hypothetical protein